MRIFNEKTKIIDGIDSVKYLSQIKAEKVCIVTDKYMIQFGLVEKVTEILRNKGVEYKIFDEVQPDPPIEIVNKGLQHIVKMRPKLLIAIGGGSVIDAAKAIMYFCIKAKEKLVDSKHIEKPLFVAIPTTSGTGSEVTAYSVITDKSKNIKIPIVDDVMIPDVAILDAEFTKTVPPSVTADTGMDVLTHAVEAYTAKNTSDFSDMYAEKSIKLVVNNLLRVYDNGNDMVAREKMHVASCMAGVAFNNAGLGITHSLAHILGARFKLSHGKSNAILLPYTIKYNSGIYDDNYSNSEIIKRYRNIAKLIGLPSLSVKEEVANLVECIKIINFKLDIPTSLKEYGIDRREFEENLDEMSEKALQDSCTLTNPREATKKDLTRIYMEAYIGA